MNGLIETFPDLVTIVARNVNAATTGKINNLRNVTWVNGVPEATGANNGDVLNQLRQQYDVERARLIDVLTQYGGAVKNMLPTTYDVTARDARRGYVNVSADRRLQNVTGYSEYYKNNADAEGDISEGARYAHRRRAGMVDNASGARDLPDKPYDRYATLYQNYFEALNNIPQMNRPQ